MDKILIIVFGITGIAFTYWFFLMKKEKQISVSESVDIIVEGGYSPDSVSVKKDKTITLNFLRKDKNSCLEEVVLSDFKIKKYLPLNKKISIQITPKESGTFNFSCGMNMFHGKIIVT